MRRIVIASAAAGLVLLGAPAASAAQPCDSYSGECPPSATATVNPTTTGSPSVTPNLDVRGGITLPMTGGELAVMLLVGALAVSGGATLVLAGRRGKHTT